MSEDRIYSLPLSRIGDFEFDQQVVDVFPDMIRRSVPGYASILAITGELAARYATPGSQIYDLGCSLGATSFAVRERIPASCRIQAVDSSAAMVRELARRVGEPKSDQASIEIQEADLMAVPIVAASVAILNFTLQFIPPAHRQTCLTSIFNGLAPGGALILSEKVSFADDTEQALITELHHAFKRANGYSELEIAQKRTSLENTLIAETLDVHMNRLRHIGFSHVSCWFQCLNFVSILAVK